MTVAETSVLIVSSQNVYGVTQLPDHPVTVFAGDGAAVSPTLARRVNVPVHPDVVQARPPLALVTLAEAAGEILTARR